MNRWFALARRDARYANDPTSDPDRSRYVRGEVIERWHSLGLWMAGRGKPHQKIVVACARELAGFVWAIATEQPLRTR
jgi:hypothetical protein